MAEGLWYDKIDRTVDWGGDESTGNKPVAGRVVQDFIKTELNSKIGVIYHDQINSLYLCFANEDDKNIYLFDPTREDLIISKLAAPSGYAAEIHLLSNHYNAVLLGKTGNYIEFGYDIKNSSGQGHVDNITYEINMIRNANTYVINGSCVYGKTVRVNIDEYLNQEGSLNATITIKGQSTGVIATTMVTYDVVSLSLTNDYDVSSTFNIGEAVVINYNIFGSSNIKYVEWYVDGKEFGLDTLTGGTVEALSVTKYISTESYVSGVHNVQFRSYVDINGEKFYTDTLYREFIIVDDNIDDIVVSFETVIPSSYGFVNKPNIYNAVQYEPCTFSYGVYNKSNLESVPVNIYINNVLKQTVNASNHSELTYTFVPDKSGVVNIKLESGSYIKEFNVNVNVTDMNINEISNNLELSLDAIGRSNADNNKDEWIYGDYKTVFNGFTWNETSGWNDNFLVIGEGMSIETDIKPLLNNTYGKTLEFEFETINVVDDNAVICDVRNSNGLGLLITASEALLKIGSAEDQVVSTKFKANERMRVSFVINNDTKMVLIYINGIVSGAIKYNSSTFSIDKSLSFYGSSDAGVKLRQVKVYNTKLTSDQILNNYILYRDTIDEMRSLYERNDILDGAFFSIEKLSQHIPVMMITGDINWLETQKDTDAQKEVDVEYINYNDPTRNFKMTGACLRIQGTSSAGYPKKNYRLYTERKKYNTTVYDHEGKIVADKKLSFKDGAAPVNCWCLKADYAESSGTHNTGVATMWNDVMYNAVHDTEGYVCRTEAQKVALDNDYPYDVRTTVDGFPIVVFARQTSEDEYIFIGKYNFNNDKSTESVFGFCDIPGFDDSKMQCWEMTENGNSYALFQTIDGWDDQAVDAEGKLKFDEDDIPIKNWASGFEARYPDDGNEADTTDLKAFAEWLISCDAEKFDKEKGEHIDLWKMAAYYVYLMRFGAVDQVVKNSMFTSEDGKKWYFINYDNDTVLGLKNTGALVYPPTITRNTVDGNTYAYAGHDSRLWNMLENNDEFMRYVSNVDSLLYEAGLTYDEAIKYFNENQSGQWCERVYNKDAEYKYITPSTTITEEGLEVNTLFMMQGSREAHRTWWLAKRFKLMDGKFNNSNYVNQNIMIKLNGSPGLDIGIKAGEYMYYGCESNSVEIQMGVELNSGESYVFHKDPSTDENGVAIPGGKDFAVGDPIYIYAPYAIEELDLSNEARYLEEITLTVKDPVLGTRLKKLIMNSLENPSQNVNFVAGLSNATNLEYLDVRGLQIGSLDLMNLKLLKTLLAKYSGLTSIELPDGCAIEELQINDRLEELKLSNLPNLKFDNIDGFDTHHVNRIYINNCPDITDNFSYYYNWVKNCKSDDVLSLHGINWVDVQPMNLIEFGKLKNCGILDLKGKITITNLSVDQVETIKDIFGSDCFTNNAELWVSAPESVFIHGPKEVRSGDSINLDVTIFSESPGDVEWEVSNGEEWVKSIVSNPDNTCILTTIEDENDDHVITVKAIHNPKNVDGSVNYQVASYDITSKKVIYATSGSITGDTTIKKDTRLYLNLLPDDFNGDYTTEWNIIGDSFNNGSISIHDPKNGSVVIKYNVKTIFDLCTLEASVTNKNGTSFVVSTPITVTDETVLMTSTSNPEVISICYAKGWCESPNVMYKREANIIMDEDFGEAFIGMKGGVAMPGYYIKTFDEFEEFTGLLTIPYQAFFQCANLKSIKIPKNIQTINGFAFGSTKLTTINIPNNVTNVFGTAFQSTPIENITVSSGNINYTSKDGVLYSTDGILIKYPEGKILDKYVIDDSVIGLGASSILGTQIKELVIGDNVVSHGSLSINSNNKLETIHIGASFSPENIGEHIHTNTSLQNITVSENHPSLTSDNGVLYNTDKIILLKYPEGRTEFKILDSVKTIGVYSCNRLDKIKVINLNDNVETLGNYAFYFCSNNTEFNISNSSHLTTLSLGALQGMGKISFINFPETLKYIGGTSLQRCSSLTRIQFNSKIAPVFTDISGSNITSAFGSNENDFTGGENTDKVVIVPTDSTGYDSDDWNNSIFSPDRNNFTLSKTL